eukprot:6568477-Prymnesium_polylepis.1
MAVAGGRGGCRCRRRRPPRRPHRVHAQRRRPPGTAHPITRDEQDGEGRGAACFGDVSHDDLRPPGEAIALVVEVAEGARDAEHH